MDHEMSWLVVTICFVWFYSFILMITVCVLPD
jgi:hypothetical protein